MHTGRARSVGTGALERGESLRTHSFYRCHENSTDATKRRGTVQVARKATAHSAPSMDSLHRSNHQARDEKGRSSREAADEYGLQSGTKRANTRVMALNPAERK